MKKFFAGLFIAVLCIAFIVLAYAEEESAPCYTPVLMDWEAKDGKDLEQKILEYWRTNAPGWEAGLYTPQKRSMTFRLGGTTEELIKPILEEGSGLKLGYRYCFLQRSGFAKAGGRRRGDQLRL